MLDPGEIAFAVFAYVDALPARLATEETASGKQMTLDGIQRTHCAIVVRFDCEGSGAGGYRTRGDGSSLHFEWNYR